MWSQYQKMTRIAVAAISYPVVIPPVHPLVQALITTTHRARLGSERAVHAVQSLGHAGDNSCHQTWGGVVGRARNRLMIKGFFFMSGGPALAGIRCVRVLAKTFCAVALLLSIGTGPAEARPRGRIRALGSRIVPALTTPVRTCLGRIFRRRSPEMTPGATTSGAGSADRAGRPVGGVATVLVDDRAARAKPNALFERTLLSARELRRLVKSPRDFVSFQTGNEAVARTQALKPTGKTNPLFPHNEVCLFEGFAPLNYGKYYVIFTKKQLGAQVRPSAVLPEWRHRGPINHEGVGYTTFKQLKQAGLIGW
jgi:hypothetical protein